LEIPQKARDSHFSHSFNNNKLDDRDHFQQNAKTSVASLRPLIGSSRNSDRHQNGTLIDFIGIPRKRRKTLSHFQVVDQFPITQQIRT
jgi:hypothetical protein